ncbi:MAG: HupE/UreJ family protein [Pseudomonadota bacterium]|jgi:hypothetical protein
MRAWAGILALLLLASLSDGAHARERSESYLTIEVDEAALRGEWKVSLRDLSPVLGLDTDGDGESTWPEIQHRRQDIEGYLGSQLRLLADGMPAVPEFERLVYGTQQGEPFVLSEFAFRAPQPIDRLDLDYWLLFQQNPEHRGKLKIVWLGKGAHQTDVTRDSGTLTFTRETASGSGFLEMLASGVWHIWIGYDHVLFLLVLLIPAVFQRAASGREAVPDFRAAFTRVVIIVSAFTVAHSITLTCAAMQWIALPDRLVESAIAASVFVAAMLNLLPSTAGFGGTWVAFGFGLLHGFGFAGVLRDTEALGGPVWRTVLAFNLGVELGQLAIVCAFLPLAYWLRNTRFYRTGVVYGGSAAAGLCALLWFWRRAFALP